MKLEQINLGSASSFSFLFGRWYVFLKRFSFKLFLKFFYIYYNLKFSFKQARSNKALRVYYCVFYNTQSHINFISNMRFY